MKDLITARGGGEVAGMLRAAPAMAVPLGAVAAWPLPLRTVVGLMLDAPEPMFVAWGAERRLVYNDLCARFMGVRHPAALGQPADQAWPEGWGALASMLEQACRGEAAAPDEVELAVEHPRGQSRPVRLSAYCTPVLGEDGTAAGALCVCRDITGARQARETERRKDAFLATLAHELRNPLAPIRTAAHVLGEPGLTRQDLAWCREVITRQAHHMALLLDDLLDVSRITSGRLELRKECAPLRDVVESAVETAQPLLDARRHRLIVQMPEEPLALEADLLRLSQVLSNLLTNAAKYTDPGGRIVLAASLQAEGLCLSVQDNGIGLSSQSLPRVFEMFSQVRSAVDRTEGGLGIGLALSRGLIELHGGRLEAASAGLGHGATFTIRLPLSCLAPAPHGSSAATAQLASSGAAPLRVLIADDNRDAAESLALLLRFEGHEVRLANDGRQALEGAVQWRPQVAILDIGMPEINGYEVARRIRLEAWGREIFLLAVTGWGQEDARRLAASAGFDQHLVKPVDPPAVIRAVAQRASLGAPAR